MRMVENQWPKPAVEEIEDDWPPASEDVEDDAYDDGFGDYPGPDDDDDE